MLSNIVIYVKDITLLAFEKYYVENITEIFTRNIFGIFVRLGIFAICEQAYARSNPYKRTLVKDMISRT